MRLIVLALFAALFLWLFAEVLFGGGMFAVRDAGHFYYPLFQFAADEWAAGRVPLWNPYDNLGQPLAADATSSVFYPAKLIFLLPLDYGWACRLYVMGHVLLAAWGAYRLARHWQASIVAAGVCAISYAFCGNVLFDCCNVVFLVGAAWLPPAMLAADRMLVDRSHGWAAAFGMVLAMMVLGGDPQMAYNAGLLAATYAGSLSLWERVLRGPLSLWERVRVRAGRDKRCEGNPPSARQGPHPDPLPKGEGTCADPLPEEEGTCGRRCRQSRWALLALAAATGLILSAIQVLPSLEFAGRSDREVDSWPDRLLARSEPDSHQESIYDFSVGPWRLAEYVWPNVSGRQFPAHRRWLSALPAEGRTWTPSLYMGILPLVLALSAMRFRPRRREKGDRHRGGDISPTVKPTCATEPVSLLPPPLRSSTQWLSWIVVLAVAASFGWFGLGYLAHEVGLGGSGPGGQGLVPGAPFGGLYWLMTLVLPGYGYFRYPAKLLVVAAMGLSVLAARGWDHSVTGLAALDPTRAMTRLRRILLWLGGSSACLAAITLAVGPFWQAWFSGVQPDMLFGPFDVAGAWRDLLGSFVQTAVLCGLFWCIVRLRGAQAKQALLLVLLAVDLALANRWLVGCAPAGLWEQTPALAAAIGDAGDEGDRPPCRVCRHPSSYWAPPAWETSSSPDRLAEEVRWDRDTLWPKYHLRPRIALAEVEGTMMLRDYAQYVSRAATADAICRLVGAEYAILPADQVLTHGQRVEVAVGGVSLWRIPRPRPRAWIVHDAEDGRADAGGAEACRMIHFDPLRVEIEATLQRPGLVVLADQFYPGWTAKVATDGEPPQPIPILRANDVMRGVRLPAGQHRIVYRYCPASFRWGAILSGLGCLALAGWALRAISSRLCFSITDNKRYAKEQG